MTGETRFEFAAVYPTGEVYAVRYLNDAQGTITGACGPLPFREVILEELPNYDYDAETGEWMMSEDFTAVRSRYTIVPLSEKDIRDIAAQAAN